MQSNQVAIFLFRSTSNGSLRGALLDRLQSRSDVDTKTKAFAPRSISARARRHRNRSSLEWRTQEQAERHKCPIISLEEGLWENQHPRRLPETSKAQGQDAVHHRPPRLPGGFFNCPNPQHPHALGLHRLALPALRHFRLGRLRQQGIRPRPRLQHRRRHWQR